MDRITKSTLLAGLLSGLVAPILWPFVILFIDGGWPTWSVYPIAALTISFFVIIITTPVCIVLGSLALIILEKYNLNTPSITGLLGFIIALLIYFLVAASNNYPSISLSWPLAAFFSIIGFTCGTLASYLSRTNKYSQQDKPTLRSGLPLL